MNVEIGTEAAQFSEKEYIHGILPIFIKKLKIQYTVNHAFKSTINVLLK